MKLEFKDVINKESGKTAIAIGMGPSLGKHIEQINKLSQNKAYVIISCNDVDKFTSINPHYWVWANSEDNIKKTYQRLNSKTAIVVYADSVDLTPRNKVASLLSVDYLPYDQRHTQNNHRCGGGKCCDFAIPGRLTIQEELKKYTNYNKLYGAGNTVALHMLSLGVLLGCKNIFVTGVDLDYSKGYVHGHNAAQARAAHGRSESFTRNLSTILSDVEVIRDSAKNIGADIFCLDDGLPISTILKHKCLP